MGIESKQLDQYRVRSLSLEKILSSKGSNLPQASSDFRDLFEKTRVKSSQNRSESAPVISKAFKRTDKERTNQAAELKSQDQRREERKTNDSDIRSEKAEATNKKPTADVAEKPNEETSSNTITPDETTQIADQTPLKTEDVKTAAEGEQAIAQTSESDTLQNQKNEQENAAKILALGLITPQPEQQTAIALPSEKVASATQTTTSSLTDQEAITQESLTLTTINTDQNEKNTPPALSEEEDQESANKATAAKQALEQTGTLKTDFSSEETSSSENLSEANKILAAQTLRTQSQNQQADQENQQQGQTAKEEKSESNSNTTLLQPVAVDLTVDANTKTEAASPTQTNRNESLSGLNPLAKTDNSLLETSTTEKKTDAPTVSPKASRFVGRVANAFKAAQDQGGEIQLRLSPPQLGAIKLRISMSEGMVIAKIETETIAAKGMLLDNLGLLRDKLAEQGIKIEQFDVDVQQEENPTGTNTGEEWQSSNQQQNSQQSERSPQNLRTASQEQQPLTNPSLPTNKNDDQINLVA